jgi:hypothetical protein
MTLEQLTWQKCPLDKPLSVACTLGEPHTEEITEVVRIGIGKEVVSYAFCKRHNAYFSVSADATDRVIMVKEDISALMDTGEQQHE